MMLTQHKHDEGARRSMTKKQDAECIIALLNGADI
jgi:hypothetical protein